MWHTFTLFAAGESWWDANGGSVAIAVAAIVAAGLAALIATRNHRQQLQHDREIREREHIRDTIDKAVSGASVAINEASAYAATPFSRPPDASQGEQEEWADSTAARMLAYFEAEQTMSANGVRLGLRLGDEHPITATHNVLRERLATWDGVIDELIIKPHGEQEMKESLRENAKLVAAAFAEFRDACRGWFLENVAPRRSLKERLQEIR